MIKIFKYEKTNIAHKDLWNSFVSNSFNGIFMFNRDYMDYHSDRFCDYSLFFYDDDELLAVLPANSKDNIFCSHGGLTYGGLIFGEKMKQHHMDDCILTLTKYLNSNGFQKLVYKKIPSFLSEQFTDSDMYSINKCGGKLKKIEPATVINLNKILKIPKGRKSQISRAKRENIVIKECNDKKDFNSFIDLENVVLIEHHNTKAVHTAEELYMLHERFPNNIHLISSFYNDEMIAGTVIFEYDNAVHTQYLAANDFARANGGLDLCIDYVINKYKDKVRYLDFGISTENDGLYLNEGLISQKEGFGGRTVAYYTWELDIK